MRQPWIATLALAALLPATAHAALEEANVARGFAPEKSFQVGEIDHVNLFNGNLVLTLPLGLGAPAGPSSSFALTLVYNSKLWDAGVEGGTGAHRG